MIKRKEQITEKAIVVGLIISLLIFALSIKANPVNTVNTVNDIQIENIGNIGNYGKDIIDKLRVVLGH